MPSKKLITKFGPSISCLPANLLAYVNIKEAKSFESSDPVVLIEDVHQNLEAQRHISEALKSFGTLAGKEEIQIGLEGAAGEFVYDLYKQFPNRVLAAQVADDFLKKGVISGPAHAGFTSYPIPGGAALTFKGVEDAALYRRNVKAYKRSSQAKAAVLSQIQNLKKAVEDRKRLVFNPALKRFDARWTAHQNGALPFASYVKYLADQAEPATLTLDVFLEAYAMEKALNFPRIEAERAVVLEKLVEKLTPADLESLLAEGLAYEEGRLTFADYYEVLKQICDKKSVSLDSATHFSDYIRYVLLTDGIDAGRLFKDAAALEQAVINKLVKSAEEKTLIDESKKIYLTEKLINFELTTEEWNEYKSTIDDVRSTNLKAFEDFYFTAEKRNQAMINNLFRDRKSSIENRTSVMVFGGFHTEGLTEILRTRRQSYIVLSPKITQVQNSAGPAYLSVFDREKTSLDKIFSGQKLFLVKTPVGARETDTALMDSALPLMVAPHLADAVVQSAAAGGPSHLAFVMELGRKILAPVVTAITLVKSKGSSAVFAMKTAGGAVRLYVNQSLSWFNRLLWKPVDTAVAGHQKVFFAIRRAGWAGLMALVLMIISFIQNSALADKPSIKNIQGTFAAGKNVMVTVGSRDQLPNIEQVVWDDMTGNKFHGNWKYTGQLKPTDRVKRHKDSNSAHINFTKEANHGYLRTQDQVHPNWYVKYYFYLDKNFDWGTGQVGDKNKQPFLSNVKLFRLWNPGDTDENFLVTAQGWDSGLMWIMENVSPELPIKDRVVTYGFQDKFKKGAWNSFAVEFIEGDVGRNNGHLRLWVNESLTIDRNVVSGEDFQGYKRPYIIGFENEWPPNAKGDQGPNDFYLTDPYVGGTARFELANHPDYSRATRREVLIPSAVQGNQVQLRVQTGTFRQGENCYLFSINSNGEVSDGHPVTITASSAIRLRRAPRVLPMGEGAKGLRRDGTPITWRMSRRSHRLAKADKLWYPGLRPGGSTQKTAPPKKPMNKGMPLALLGAGLFIPVLGRSFKRWTSALSVMVHDRVLGRIQKREIDRQKNTLNGVPSMTHTPAHVLLPLALPIHAHAGEQLSRLAEERWLEVFENHYAGKQDTLADKYSVLVGPHSGSQANQIVDHALLKPGDVVMGMRLDHGGHLTHGHPLNFSGTFFRIVPDGEKEGIANGYGVNPETGLLDYNVLMEQALQYRPRKIVAGGTAYPGQWDWDKLLNIKLAVEKANKEDIRANRRKEADGWQVYLHADIAHLSAQIRVGAHPSPFGKADVITLTNQKARGPRGGVVFYRNGLGNFQEAQRVIQGEPLWNAVAAKAAHAHFMMSPEYQEDGERIGTLMKTFIDEGRRLGMNFSTQNGSDNHMVLIETHKTYGLFGGEAQDLLQTLGGLGDVIGIGANSNTIPRDDKAELQLPKNERQTARRTKGIRFGTPSLAARKVGPDDVGVIAQTIHEILSKSKIEERVVEGKTQRGVTLDKRTAQAAKRTVRRLARKYPLPDAELYEQILEGNMVPAWKSLIEKDPELAGVLLTTLEEQAGRLDLTPGMSEPLPWVAAAAAHPSSDVYAEGFPGERYYPMNDINDEMEVGAQNEWRRLLKVSDVYDVNVQPHSREQALQIALLAAANPGQKVVILKRTGQPTPFDSRLDYIKRYYGVTFCEVSKTDHETMTAALRNIPETKGLAPLILYDSAQFDSNVLYNLASIIHGPETLLVADTSNEFLPSLHKKNASPLGAADIVVIDTQRAGGLGGGIMLVKRRVVPSLNESMNVPAARRETTTIADLVRRSVIPGAQGGPLLHFIASKSLLAGWLKSAEAKRVSKRLKKNVAVFMEEFEKEPSSNLEALRRGSLIAVRDYGLVESFSELLEGIGIDVGEAQFLDQANNDDEECMEIEINLLGATMRGLGVSDMRRLARLIKNAYKVAEEGEEVGSTLEETRLTAEVQALARQHPVHPELLNQLHFGYLRDRVSKSVQLNSPWFVGLLVLLLSFHKIASDSIPHPLLVQTGETILDRLFFFSTVALVLAVLFLGVRWITKKISNYFLTRKLARQTLQFEQVLQAPVDFNAPPVSPLERILSTARPQPLLNGIGQSQVLESLAARAAQSPARPRSRRLYYLSFIAALFLSFSSGATFADAGSAARNSEVLGKAFVETVHVGDRPMGSQPRKEYLKREIERVESAARNLPEGTEYLIGIDSPIDGPADLAAELETLLQVQKGLRVRITDDMRENGLVNYHRFVEKASTQVGAGQGLKALADKKYKDVQLVLITENPGLYFGDKDFMAWWTIVTLIRGLWVAVGVGTILKAAEVAAQHA